MTDVEFWFFAVCVALSVSIFASIALIAMAARRPKREADDDWFV